MKTILFAAAVLVAASVAIAADDPIAQRQALMKENGKATGGVVKMLKGEEPFVLATAQAALAVYANTAAKPGPCRKSGKPRRISKRNSPNWARTPPRPWPR